MNPLVKKMKTINFHDFSYQLFNALRCLFYEPRLHSMAIDLNKVGKSNNPPLIRQDKMKLHIKKTIIIITATAINSYSYAELVITSIEYALNTVYVTFTSK